MNPHQKNKVDVKSLSPEEQRLFRLYGKLPNRSDHFAKHLKERKYFDSGDYAMSKAGKGDGVDAGAVGSQHPVPENIPHLSSPVNNNSGAVSTSPNGSASSSLPGSGPTAPGGVIPKHAHHGSVPGIQAGSPIKEGSFLQRETSVDDLDEDDKGGDDASGRLAAAEGIPIRR
ncbi:cAMP-regulated phosphoprotein/endosulfine conserved region [Geosmithia morbida]|uniref:mRNA stability protein n=1 Tax=Geosmithia morbida TaxID=1094350 RepID=A0A9P5D303_9HYPO|nr:cAMP-regulated phosphoprotein/endosulfine conserved region [Geosmithia morbida]KAF4125658.1 cAMP-regulated phosphoprotein/endosulfine conserved region [Geosmithia morbida]